MVVGQATPPPWTGVYLGRIGNNMGLTTEQILGDEQLMSVHAGAVESIETKCPGLAFAANRPYCFDRTQDGFELGYRTRDGAPHHHYVVVRFVLKRRDYAVIPTA
jgi:hypothetical protein